MQQPLVTDLRHRQDGHLRLRFERVGERTRLVQASSQSPLAVMRTLSLDDAMPDLAVVFLLNTTAGVFQGDRLTTEVVAAAGARVHLTTTSATKVFSMPDGEASIATNLVVEAGALLEHLPDPLIPFAGSRLRQTIRCVVAPGGSLLYGDIVAPGRTGMGEQLAYAQYAQRLTIEDGAGNLAYHEAFDLRPGERPLERLGVLGRSGPAAMGTVVAIVPDDAPGLLDAVRDVLVTDEGLSAAAGVLPDGRGVGVRLLAAETAAVRAGVRQVWQAFRMTRYGVPATNLRK